MEAELSGIVSSNVAKLQVPLAAASAYLASVLREIAPAKPVAPDAGSFILEEPAKYKNAGQGKPNFSCKYLWTSE